MKANNLENPAHKELIDHLSDNPVWNEHSHSWSCPPGYSYPKCSSCGHNFYESKPVKVELARQIGMCAWCIQENNEWLDSFNDD